MPNSVGILLTLGSTYISECTCIAECIYIFGMRTYIAKKHGSATNVNENTALSVLTITINFPQVAVFSMVLEFLCLINFS